MTPYAKEQFKELHQKLLWMRTIIGEGKYSPTWGICSHICASFVQFHQLEGLWRKWPKYSGDPLYPVPGTGVNKDSCNRAYREAYLNGSMWTGDYGALRLELLHYLIEATNDENSTPTS